MTSSDPHSVVNTTVEPVEVDGRPGVRKTVRPNVELDVSAETLKGWIDEYAGLLRGAGLPLPEIFGSEITEEGALAFTCARAGRNLVETSGGGAALLDERPLLRRVAEALALALRAGLALDPHPKNFTLDRKGELWFVDFSPPYGVREYRWARLRAAGHDRRLILDSFAAFEPENLGYHFAGDFLDLDRELEPRLSELHPVLTEVGLVEVPVGPEEFLERAVTIRALEDERLKRQVFLL